MRLARGFLVFSYGLFTIAAQSLLFREFLTTFEGNDISVGIFFGSWFLWVAAAAASVNSSKRLAEWLTRNLELLFVLYLPAFVAQFTLIVEARELAGLESYALWSVRAILAVSMVVNAPLSIITGLLFPAACRWVRQDGTQAVAHVYVVEGLGSFAGGLGVTVLLWLGASPAQIFLILGLVVSLSVYVVRLAVVFQRPGGSTAAACGLACLGAALFGIGLARDFDAVMMQHVRLAKWRKLLEPGGLAGAFQTPQAEYLYGTYRDQWVAVREGSVCEALPDEETAGRTAAITLCQNPNAESVLVIGSGLGLCERFLQLPQIKSLTWVHPDSEYALRVENFIPAGLRINDARFGRPAGDIRAMLKTQEHSYDIIILNLPDATSSVLNRYYTVEFYELLKQSLRPDGVVAVRVTAGENIMGTELINLGASVRLTLQAVFAKMVLTPGEQSWFIASDSGRLSPDPAVLRDRFASIERAEAVFSAQGLLSVYLPDRAAAALQSYAQADLPESLLLNRDSRPLTHLYSLLLTAKQSGAALTRLAKLLTFAGLPVFLVPVLVFLVLRALYVLGSVGGEARSSFDTSFLVFSTGAVGIGAVIVLMYLYQTYFGSLYLHIGVVSSLFMAGLTAGAALARRLLEKGAFKSGRAAARLQVLLFIVLGLHTLIIAGIASVSPQQWARTVAGHGLWQSGHLLFGAAFVLCGLCAGCYFPIGARQLSDCRFEVARTGAKLETADHVGAAVGGVLTSLVLVPVLGTTATLSMFIVLLLANVPAGLWTLLRPEKLSYPGRPGLAFRRAGYALLAIAATVVVCSNILVYAGRQFEPALPMHTARALAGRLALVPASAELEESGRQISYYKVTPAEPNAQVPAWQRPACAGYIFSSADLAAGVRGFGGKLNLAIYVDASGKLVDFHIIRCNETPSYLELLSKWRESLKGRPLFGPDPLAEVDTVSGATVSSRAILTALRTSARNFAREVLMIPPEGTGRPAVARGAFAPDLQAVYLLAASILVLVVVYRGGFWSRLATLTASFVLGGIVLNAQYSSEQIATLLSLDTPAAKISGAFGLAVGVPVLVALFGNIYCGYICPFGAAQELLSYLLPARLTRPLARQNMQAARFIKYVVLAVLVLAFFLSRDKGTLSADPLITVFNLRMWLSLIHQPTLYLVSPTLLILAAAAVGSVLYVRFWCRYLCPVGAFLALLNKVAILKRYLPAKKFGRCEFGLTPADQLDCIQCDRCRYPARPATMPARLAGRDQAQTGLPSRCLVFAVLAVAVFVSGLSAKRFLEAIPSTQDYAALVSVSGGKPRDVDIKRLRALIDQKKLSDREAEFYKKVEAGDAGSDLSGEGN